MYRYKALGSAALLASGLLVANAQATEIVRWVDEHGVTHFTERHLAQAPATRIDVQPANSMQPAEYNAPVQRGFRSVIKKAGKKNKDGWRGHNTGRRSRY